MSAISSSLNNPQDCRPFYLEDDPIFQSQFLELFGGTVM